MRLEIEKPRTHGWAEITCWRVCLLYWWPACGNEHDRFFLPTPYQALNLSKTELKGSGTAPRSCNWRNVPLATAGHMRRVLRSVGTDKALASLEQLGAWGETKLLRLLPKNTKTRRQRLCDKHKVEQKDQETLAERIEGNGSNKKMHAIKRNEKEANKLWKHIWSCKSHPFCVSWKIKTVKSKNCGILCF